MANFSRSDLTAAVTNCGDCARWSRVVELPDIGGLHHHYERWPCNGNVSMNAHEGFTGTTHAQRLLSTFAMIASLMHPGRHPIAAKNYREVMRGRFAYWREFAGLLPATY